MMSWNVSDHIGILIDCDVAAAHQLLVLFVDRIKNLDGRKEAAFYIFIH